MNRKEIIDILTDEMAWANTRRIQVDPKKHKPQIVLDNFRGYLFMFLAEMNDNELPQAEKAWEFIYCKWASFILHRYNIEESWEDFKKTDRYKQYRNNWCRFTNY